MRIAMWSGPRNISTAMMRSWENRDDCSVVDEPFYAYYLAQTQSPHPFFNEILATQTQDFDQVANQLTRGHVDTPIQYQKHMTHHMLKNVPLDWTKHLLHCFLIRDPSQVVHSYTKSRGVCTAQDIGIIRQAQLYTSISEITEQDIPVIDSNEVLKDPHRILSLLCKKLSIPFTTKMLNWPKGRRDSDGVWAPHWYHSVEASTSFAPYEEIELILNDQQKRVVDEVMPYYELLSKKKI